MNKVASHTWLNGAGAVLVGLFLISCATQLAPPYDEAVAEGLNTSSTETMTLLAEMAGGTKPDTFSAREEKYNMLIGRLDALAILSGARPIPKNRVSETINKLLEERHIAELLT